MPTKTEQADLLQVMFGRNGEAPVPVLAAQSPADCFPTAIEAVRIAVKYRTPVIVLSDGYLANGAEPWPVPDVGGDPADRPAVRRARPTRSTRPATRSSCPTCAMPRRWPGRGPSPAPPALQHRIGGIEKAKDTGAVSYDPANHEEMVRTRAAKIAGIVRDIPDLVVDDPAGRGREERERRPASGGRGGSSPHTDTCAGPGAGLGLDVRADRGRRPPGPQDRPAGRVHPPAAPQPVPGQPRRRSCGATTG